MIDFDVARDTADLRQILRIQQANLPSVLNTEEMKTEGFVTLQHDLELLETMNMAFPHIVARDKMQVVAYALVMTTTFADRIPALYPMFNMIDQLEYNGRVLDRSAYVVMGQICVQLGYRGQGIFRRLYQKMAEELRRHFPFVITEVDESNPRSLAAHHHVGFETLHTYFADEKKWHILIWNWV